MDIDVSSTSDFPESQIIDLSSRRRRPELRDLKKIAKEKLKQTPKCHYCRKRKGNAGIIPCINYNECHHAFCHECISKYFRNRETRKVPKIIRDNWVCFTCKGLCHCDRCKIDLVKELSLTSAQILSDEKSELLITDKGSISYNNSNNIQSKVQQ